MEDSNVRKQTKYIIKTFQRMIATKCTNQITKVIKDIKEWLFIGETTVERDPVLESSN